MDTPPPKPIIRLSTDGLWFGNLQPGASSEEKSITIENVGGPVTINYLAFEMGLDVINGRDFRSAVLIRYNGDIEHFPITLYVKIDSTGLVTPKDYRGIITATFGDIVKQIHVGFDVWKTK